MKVKDEYVLENIAGTWMIMDTDSKSVNFNKILALNDTGKLLWETLEKGADQKELISVLIDHFGIDADQASNDVETFTKKLKELGCIEDEG